MSEPTDKEMKKFQEDGNKVARKLAQALKELCDEDNSIDSTSVIGGSIMFACGVGIATERYDKEKFLGGCSIGWELVEGRVEQVTEDKESHTLN